jgi:hypothetical protein
LHGGATILYTEDLQHGQVIETLSIKNPFKLDGIKRRRQNADRQNVDSSSRSSGNQDGRLPTTKP